MGKDATNRLGEKLAEFKFPIEQAIAVKIPSQLAHAEQGQLKDAISKSEFELYVYSFNRDQLNFLHRWPESGWISGNIGDLADLIELAALSENILDIGLNILEEGISRASAFLRRKYVKSPQVLDKIAKTLSQKDSLQTTRMAKAVDAGPHASRDFPPGTKIQLMLLRVGRIPIVLPETALLSSLS